MVFSPRVRPRARDQLAVPKATTGHWPFATRITSLSPEKFCATSRAVPEKVMILLLTQRPLNGLVTVTTGRLVSVCPPGATRNRSDPSEFEFTLARAIWYVVPLLRFKLRYACCLDPTSFTAATVVRFPMLGPV